MKLRKSEKSEKKKTEAAETVAQRASKKYQKSEDALKEFMTDPDVMDLMKEFYKLIEDRNAALDEAVRAVKSELQASDQARLVVGPIGAQKRYRRYYDTDFLAKRLPNDQKELVLKAKTVYELNQPLLEQLTRQGELDNEIVRESYHEEEQSPSAMPGTPKPFELPPISVYTD